MINSLIKKLYSAEEENTDNRQTKQPEFSNLDRVSVQNIDDSVVAGEDDQQKIKKEIESRETFSYKYFRFWQLWRFDKKWCCCCRPKRMRDDHLFKDAKSKLNEELDILEIIKKLRVHQFASTVTLKPHQRDLINFFQEYKLCDDSQKSSRDLTVVNLGDQTQADMLIDDENESEDTRDEGQVTTQEAAVNHLYQSISILDPDTCDIDAKIL